MNLQRCESFAREAQTLVQQADQILGQIDQINAVLRIVGQQGNFEKMKQLGDQKAQAEESLKLVSTVLFERVNRSSLEDAKRLVVDLLVRCELAQREFTQWRAAVAEFEFQASQNEPEFDRVLEERKLDVFRRRFERRVELADEQVPNKPVVLIP